MEFAVGHLLKTGPAGTTRFCFQNFVINQNLIWDNVTHTFLPFGFSGAVASLKGDSVDAAIRLANNEIARSWAISAFEEIWTANVSVMLFDPVTHVPQRMLYDYWGAVSVGTWNDQQIDLSLDTILDAVTSEIPARRLHRVQVGNLPFTAQISV
jgi:hypothetical protein